MSAEKIKVLLDSRSVKRVVYLHTDHFEPWRYRPGVPNNDMAQINMSDMLKYGERVAQIEFARKLTHFYLPTLLLTKSTSENVLRLPGDTMGIVRRDEFTSEIAKQSFAEFSSLVPAEFQVHFHHEFITWNAQYYSKSVCYDDRACPSDLDFARFDMGLTETLDRIRQDTGAAHDDWFFVHGMWALNASDPDVCCIIDEIARLKAAGCRGDFTFPAGRPHCDPSFNVPSLVRPVSEAKGYDLAAADPVAPFSSVDRDERFFIWSSRVDTNDASLDFFADRVAENLAQPGQWMERALSGSVQDGETLYLKTHAHSMNGFYFDERSGADGGVFPHEHWGVRAAFDMLGEALAAGGGVLDCLTASEVYRELTTQDERPGDTRLVNYGYSGLSACFPPDLLTQADRVSLEVLSARLERLGPAEGGLYDHYVEQVRRGKVLSRAETAMADAVERTVPRDVPLIHLYASLGVLAAALALRGYRVTTLEGTVTRCAAQAEIRDRLAPAIAAAGGAWSIETELYRGGRDFAGACVVACNAIVTMTAEERAQVIASFASAPMTLLDITRFVRRAQRAEAEEILVEFELSGLSGQVLSDMADGGQIHRFWPKSINTPLDAL